MPKPKTDDIVPPTPDDEDLTVLPGEPLDTSSNDEPDADANGDSDDERSDENVAVPD